MIHRTVRVALAAALLALPGAVSAAEAPPAAGGACIVRAQGELLIATLKQRNDQLRELSARLREVEARAAVVEAKAAQVDAASRALVVASTRNRELVEIGEAILTDYERMNLGKRVAAREPLTGLYRVRLENKLQEYRGQIAAEGFYPEKELEAARAAAAPAPAPTSK